MIRYFYKILKPVIYTAISLIFIPVITNAQILPEMKYPKDYFQWPLALKPEIVANFGELRPNHFHMGFDCRTNLKQNMPVLASAEGYIARVKIEPFGFGRCIYINHPNGYTSLYAHLNDFFPELEKYVAQQQYLQKSWKVFLDIPANLFPVSKGQFIAGSGSTGGSEGPHLHFEIRETKTDKVLNPSLFGFAIPDDIAPDVNKLALYDRNLSTYEQTPKLFNLKKIKGVYGTLSDLLTINSDKVSFGINAFDRCTASANRNGIFEALLYDNENPVLGFQFNKIGYEETRYLNGHIDYKLRSNGGPFVEHLSRLPGYANDIYKMISGNGVINIADDNIHRIKIEVSDANGNTSIVQFKIRRDTNLVKKTDSAISSPYQQKEFYPGFINIFESKKIGFYLPEKCLYDSFRFQYKEIIPKTGNTIYQIHNINVPLQTAFPLKMKGNIPPSLKNKVVIERFWNAKSDFEKAVPVSVSNEEWFVASFREFGNFQLQVDTIPPTITPMGFKDNMNTAKLNRLAFVVTDNSKGLKNFSATLDGKWLRFSNDKGKTFIYIFDAMCQPGLHELILNVEDIVGNSTEKIYHFMR